MEREFEREVLERLIKIEEKVDGFSRKRMFLRNRVDFSKKK